MLRLLSACYRLPDVVPAGLPPAPPPVAAPVCWAEYARGDGPAELTTRGPTATRTMRGTVSGLLVRHPRGEVLVDVGNSPDFLAQLDGYDPVTKFIVRQLPGRMAWVASVRGALSFVGADPDRVAAIVGSHAHLDHVGGVEGLPGVPVLLGRDELPFVAALADAHRVDLLPAQAQAVVPRMRGLAFDGPPVGPFPASHDLYADGSIVLVPMPGHTPGSVGTLVRVAGVPPVLHVGDVVMIAEGYERPAPKGAIVRILDGDYRATGDEVAKLHALWTAEPDLVVLPAHDRAAWERLFGPTPTCIGVD